MDIFSFSPVGILTNYLGITNSSAKSGKSESTANKGSEASSKGLAEDAWDWLTNSATNIMTDSYGTGGVTGCGYEDGSEIEPQLDPDADGGIDLIPGPDSGLEVNPETGEVEMPGDIFNEVLTVGESGFDFFQETSEIVLTSGYIEGSGLQDLALAIELGTDSTILANMPPDNLETPELIESCLDGLIDNRQLSQEEIDFQNEYNANLGEGEEPVYLGCDEDDYSTFVACPDDPANRVPLYLSAIRIEAFEVIDGEYFPLEENSIYSETFTNIDDLYNPEAEDALITPLGVTCGGEPQAVRINIPENFYSNGKLAIRVSVVLVADAREAHGYDIDYRTGFRARIISL
ncbi:MAG: hypothetical protein ABID35_05375 [Candidatus Margulisiibacteriota bacterium]